MVNRSYRYYEGIPLFPFGYGLYDWITLGYMAKLINIFADRTPLLSIPIWRSRQQPLKLVRMWQWVLLWQILAAELLMRYIYGTINNIRSNHSKCIIWIMSYIYLHEYARLFKFMFHGLTLILLQWDSLLVSKEFHCSYHWVLLL